jgi:hypothetical protein
MHVILLPVAILNAFDCDVEALATLLHLITVSDDCLEDRGKCFRQVIWHCIDDLKSGINWMLVKLRPQSGGLREEGGI